MKIHNASKTHELKKRLLNLAIFEIKGKNRDVRLVAIGKRLATLATHMNKQNYLFGHMNEVRTIPCPSAQDMRLKLGVK